MFAVLAILGATLTTQVVPGPVQLKQGTANTPSLKTEPTLELVHDHPLLTTKTLSMLDGVPSSSVIALEYDNHGFLLVGTTGGLARYDGSRFETFLSADVPGLEGDRITALMTDQAGRTWVGPYGVAPSIFEDNKFREVCHRSVLRSVRQIYQDSDGVIWLVGSGLGRFENGVLRVIGAQDGLPDTMVRRVIEDSMGSLWVATKAGVLREKGSGFEMVLEDPSGWVTTDGADHVWAKTETGWLINLTDPSEPMIEVGELVLFDDFIDETHGHLLATHRGLVALSPARPDGTGLSLKLVHEPAAPNGSIQRINCLLAGPGGDLWVGTEVAGLEYAERRYVRLLDRSDGQAQQPIYSVRQLPEGQVFIAEGSGAIAFTLDAQGNRGSFGPQSSKTLSTVDVSSNSNGTWLSTSAGLVEVRGNQLLPDPKWAEQGGPLVAHSDGSVWMVLDTKIQCVIAADGATGPMPSIELPGSQIHSLGSFQGTIIAACDHKLVGLNQETLTWERLADIGDAAVRQMREGEGDVLWLSTYGHGLMRLASDGRLDRWSRSAGLPDPFLGWIGPVDSHGDLWLNSNTGVLRVSVAGLNAYTAGEATSIEARVFRTPEANGAGGAELEDGSFVLPTVEGLAIFDRAGTPPASPAPRVRVHAPFIDDRPLPGSGGIHGPANLRFEFTAPIYPTSDDALFQYRLLGFDDRWINARNAREVRYPNLGRGEYLLEVRARTPMSAWSKPVHSARIEITPRWHEMLWVRLLIASVAALVLRNLVTMRTRALARQNAILSQEIDQRLSAEAHLRSSEERFRHLFHTAPSAILAWDPSGNLLDRNARADELFKWGHNQPKQTLPWELFEDTTLGRKAFEEVLTQESDISLDAMASTGSGRAKRCQWQFAPTFSASGEIVSVIALISDFSRQDRDARSLARLRESLVRAEESERSRIARELHDDLSQRLVALAMEAHMVDQALKAGKPLKRCLLGSFRSEIEHIATDVHALSRRLHPTIVDDLGLLTALRSECTRRSRMGDIDIVLNVGDDFEEPPRETALTMFRIAQEATGNASRHSGANEIVVSLDMDDDLLLLTVNDDGVGIDPTLVSVGRGGIGMNSMRERARLAGGDLFIESAPGKGTRVTAKVPRHAEAHNRALAIHGKWDRDA